MCQSNSIQNTLLEAFDLILISLWNLKIVAGFRFKMMFKILCYGEKDFYVESCQAKNIVESSFSPPFV